MRSPNRALANTKITFLDKLFAYLTNRSPFDRFLLLIFSGVFLLSGGAWLWHLSASNQVLVLNSGRSALAHNLGASGGTLREGVLGVPRFVNPVLATTRADQDMSTLLFRGLYRHGMDGELTPDLAEQVTVSDDGLTYNVKLRQNQYWHDGAVVNADDVIFTIGLIQNPELRSPAGGAWNAVTVERVDEYELNIVLAEPYSPFIENLTIGILPQHVWEFVLTDEFPFSPFNIEPIGSGPFKLENVTRDQSGLVTRYDLTRFAKYQPASHADAVSVRFFANEADIVDALERDLITHTAALSNERVAYLTERYIVYEAPLPRVFAFYPNQNRNPALRDRTARQALSVAINRADLIKTVLAGYGEATTTPIPVGFDATTTTTTATTTPMAATILLDGGWQKTDAGGWEKIIDEETVPLAVTIATVNTPLFEKTAEYVARAWETLGVDVGIAFYDQSDLVQAVIRPRNYELLLYGTEIGRALDYYPFWHSSQREDPGLNVALYTSISADGLLESYRVTRDQSQQAELLQTFTDEIVSEIPAIFLFNPTFTYVTSSDTPLTLPKRLTRPSDRLAAIANWHVESESLWPFLAP